LYDAGARRLQVTGCAAAAESRRAGLRRGST